MGKLGGIYGKNMMSSIPQVKKAYITNIRCCNNNQEVPCERITDIKYYVMSPTVSPTLLGETVQESSVAEAVDLIETNQYEFYVETQKSDKPLVHVAELNGHKYLRSEPNDTENDNLLKLPDF
jgi:hypothetical protein